MSLLFHFATQAEAEATQQRLKDLQVDHAEIIIGGIGSLSTALTLGRKLQEGNELISLGIAGSLTDHLSVGHMVEISTIQKFTDHPDELDSHSEEFLKALQPTITLQKSGYRLITSDYPIHMESHRTKLQQRGDLIDMEGYAVAMAALKLNVPCKMWKIVSDRIEPGGWKEIQRNLPTLSKILADKACEYCKQFAS